VKILALEKFTDEAGYIAEGRRNAAGAVQNARTLEQNFSAWDDRHRGAYVFVAFHPSADKAVAEYVSEGTVGDDAGTMILAMFLVQPIAPRKPRNLKPEDVQFGMALTVTEHPAYELARYFFPQAEMPRLPGLIFFDRLSKQESSIYVLIEGIGTPQVRRQIRTALEIANRSIARNGSNDPVPRLDFDRLAAGLMEASLTYRRSGKKGLRSAAFVIGAWIKKHRGGIAAAIPKLAGLGAKAATGGAAGE
jgi:hypothetical protein